MSAFMSSRLARSKTRARRRRGYGLAELALSAIVLTVAMTVTARMVVWVGAERRASERRQWALQEVANLTERITTGPYDEVTPERARAALDGVSKAPGLTSPEWTADVTDEPGPVPSRRLRVSVRWKDRYGEWVAPVGLTSWVYKRGDGR